MQQHRRAMAKGAGRCRQRQRETERLTQVASEGVGAQPCLRPMSSLMCSALELDMREVTLARSSPTLASGTHRITFTCPK
jgi:hypothetical protein